MNDSEIPMDKDFFLLDSPDLNAFILSTLSYSTLLILLLGVIMLTLLETNILQNNNNFTSTN